jgi:hypothetical protein
MGLAAESCAELVPAVFPPSGKSGRHGAGRGLCRNGAWCAVATATASRRLCTGWAPWALGRTAKSLAQRTRGASSLSGVSGEHGARKGSSRSDGLSAAALATSSRRPDTAWHPRGFPTETVIVSSVLFGILSLKRNHFGGSDAALLGKRRALPGSSRTPMKRSSVFNDVERLSWTFPIARRDHTSHAY